MANIVRQMVPLGLEHVVMFVFDLPAPTACLGHGCDVVRAQAMIGDKAVVIQLFTRFGLDPCDLEPIDQPGIVPTTQEDVIDGTRYCHCREAAVPSPSFPLG